MENKNNGIGTETNKTEWQQSSEYKWLKRNHASMCDFSPAALAA